MEPLQRTSKGDMIRCAFKRSGWVKHRVDWRQAPESRGVEEPGQPRGSVAM